MFYIENDGHKNSEATYTYNSQSTVSINHTYVGSEQRGSGVGASLIHAAVEWARKNNLKIQPNCSFARAVFQKHHEWNDVLDSTE